MIIVLEKGLCKRALEVFLTDLRNNGAVLQVLSSEKNAPVEIHADAGAVDRSQLRSRSEVRAVFDFTEPFELASRAYHPESSVIDVNGVRIGGDRIVIMAGPCSVESVKQIDIIAGLVRRAGADVLRGGAFKPRTSPYGFQGLGEPALRLLHKTADEYGMPCVTEVLEPEMVDRCAEYADILQVGARNMQNFPLLRRLGQTRRPVLLKRGASALITEWLCAAEYILSGGNRDVVLCERGIRTFENATRNTLDIGAVPVAQMRSHLPVIVDPSHAAGSREIVSQLACAGIAAGAHGLIIEVHHNPAEALSDGPQALLPEMFEALVAKVHSISAVVGRSATPSNATPLSK